MLKKRKKETVLLLDFSLFFQLGKNLGPVIQAKMFHRVFFNISHLKIPYFSRPEFVDCRFFRPYLTPKIK